MTVSDEDINDLMDMALIERRTKVMFLRNAGATWAKVAQECQVSVATCRKDMQIVRRDINNEQPTDVVARHRAVIFDIQRANYPAMMRGDKDAAMVILRALHREANLLGLNSPTRVLASVSAEDFSNEAARLINRINELDADTLKELTRDTTAPDILDAEEVPLTEPVQRKRTPFDKPRMAGEPGEPDREAHPGQAVADDAAPARDEQPPEPSGDTRVPGQSGPAELPDADDGWSNL